MNKHSTERIDFDSVLLLYNYRQKQNPRYAARFTELVDICRKRNIAVQTIKSAARRPWNDRPKTYNTYFYEPLENQDATEKSVHWAMGLLDSFVITAGDVRLLPIILAAADSYVEQPPDEVMRALVDEYNIQ